MSVLYFLENIRTPIMNTFFSLITLFGEETLFIVIGLIVFWCASKNCGYYILCVGFLGTVINQFLKMWFRIPRPWIKDPSFTIVESARDAATGYSFPSGHTQVSVGLYGGIARWTKSRVLRGILLCLCVLVPFSRLYLGVHTPLDLGVSVVIAGVLVLGGYELFKKAENSPKTMYGILATLTVITVAYLLFICNYNFPESVYSDTNLHNLISAKENGYTMLGCILGLICIYTADNKFIKFDTKAVWWAQILKVVIGIALVLAVKEGLKGPLEAVFGTNLIARSIRYFLIVIVGGALWPMTFKWFSKLGTK